MQKVNLANNEPYSSFIEAQTQKIKIKLMIFLRFNSSDDDTPLSDDYISSTIESPMERKRYLDRSCINKDASLTMDFLRLS